MDHAEVTPLALEKKKRTLLLLRMSCLLVISNLLSVFLFSSEPYEDSTLKGEVKKDLIQEKRIKGLRIPWNKELFFNNLDSSFDLAVEIYQDKNKIAEGLLIKTQEGVFLKVDEKRFPKILLANIQVVEVKLKKPRLLKQGVRFVNVQETPI